MTLKTKIKMKGYELASKEIDRIIAAGRGDLYVNFTLFESTGEEIPITKKQDLKEEFDRFLKKSKPMVFVANDKLYLLVHGLETGHIATDTRAKVDKEQILELVPKTLYEKYKTINLISCKYGLKKEYEVDGIKIAIPEWANCDKPVSTSCAVGYDSHDNMVTLLYGFVKTRRLKLLSALINQLEKGA